MEGGERGWSVVGVGAGLPPLARKVRPEYAGLPGDGVRQPGTGYSGRRPLGHAAGPEAGSRPAAEVVQWAGGQAVTLSFPGWATSALAELTLLAPSSVSPSRSTLCGGRV